MYGGVSSRTVGRWAMKYYPHEYQIRIGRNRELLSCQEILEHQPNTRLGELAEMVGVVPSLIWHWKDRGKIDVDVRCLICDEPASKKYCTSCSEKGWGLLHAKYGMTLYELQNMPDYCEVCGSTENLHVDHNHDTGKYRGVLCQHCNMGLGHFRDDPNLLIKATQYLWIKK